VKAPSFLSLQILTAQLFSFCEETFHKFKEGKLGKENYLFVYHFIPLPAFKKTFHIRFNLIHFQLAHTSLFIFSSSKEIFCNINVSLLCDNNSDSFLVIIFVQNIFSMPFALHPPINSRFCKFLL